MRRHTVARSLINQGACTLAIAIALCTPAYALEVADGTENPPKAGEGETPAEVVTDPSEGVIVVGQRQALKRAEQIKRDADTIVDSITATWFAVLVGQGLVPDRYHPIADTAPEDALQDRMSLMRSAVEKRVRELPTLEAFLASCVRSGRPVAAAAVG